MNLEVNNLPFPMTYYIHHMERRELFVDQGGALKV